MLRVTPLLMGLLCSLALSTPGCAEPPAAAAVSAPSPVRAFYFWRTRLELSPTEHDALSRLQVGRLYVRFFDVEWDGASAAPRPVAIVGLPGSTSLPPGLEVVPVVFVRADVFGRSAAQALPALAQSVWRQARHLIEQGRFAVHELQVDCDWTDTTRAAYFEFLGELARLTRPAGVGLSATIRLHQVKYRERTGVPPVERGMLMFYNMGRIAADSEGLSIFDPANAARYTARIGDYPLPLDVALPIWAWTVHERDDEVVGLLQTTDPAELDSVSWLRRVAPGRFVATRTGFLHGSLLREGDVLRGESMGSAETLAAAQMLSAALPRPAARPQSRSVALFDLTERNLARHGETRLEQLFPLFR